MVFLHTVRCTKIRTLLGGSDMMAPLCSQIYSTSKPLHPSIAACALHHPASVVQALGQSCSQYPLPCKAKFAPLPPMPHGTLSPSHVPCTVINARAPFMQAMCTAHVPIHSTSQALPCGTNTLLAFCLLAPAEIGLNLNHVLTHTGPRVWT